MTMALATSAPSTTRSVPRTTVLVAFPAASAMVAHARSRNAASGAGTRRLTSRQPGTKDSGKQTICAPALAAFVIACVASVIDSSGESGKRTFASAMRTWFMRCSVFLRLRLIQRRTKPLCQRHGIVVRPEVHEVQPRRLVKHVTVQCRHLDTVIVQGADHRVHFVAAQHEVAGDRRLAASGWLEVDRGGDTHRGRNLMPHRFDLLTTRNTHLVDDTVQLAGDAKCLRDAHRVEINGRCRRGR